MAIEDLYIVSDAFLLFLHSSHLLTSFRLIGIGEISMFDVMTKISFCQILQLKGWKGDPLMVSLC